MPSLRVRLATLKEEKLSSGTMSTVRVEGADLVMMQVSRAVHGPLRLLSINNNNKITICRPSWVVPLTTFRMALFSYQPQYCKVHNCSNASRHVQLRRFFWMCNVTSQSTAQVSSGEFCDVVKNLRIALNKVHFKARKH